MSPRAAAAGLVAFGVLAAAFGLWRAASALAHYQAAAEIVDDPSLRELEEVSALFDGAVAAVAIVHAAAAFVLARRPVKVNLRLLLATAAFGAAWVAAPLGALSLPSVPGVYPLGVVAGSFALSMLLRRSVLAVYLGAVAGSTAGCFIALDQAELLPCVFVVVPFVVLALLGASGAALLGRKRATPGVP